MSQDKGRLTSKSRGSPVSFPPSPLSCGKCFLNSTQMETHQTLRIYLLEQLSRIHVQYLIKQLFLYCLYLPQIHGVHRMLYLTTQRIPNQDSIGLVNSMLIIFIFLCQISSLNQYVDSHIKQTLIYKKIKKCKVFFIIIIFLMGIRRLISHSYRATLKFQRVSLCFTCLLHNQALIIGPQNNTCFIYAYIYASYIATRASRYKT